MIKNPRTLFFCNTYFQLIVAIQLKLTSFSDRNVGIWLSNRSRNAEKISSRLSSIRLFDEVRYIEISELEKTRATSSKLRKTHDIITLNMGQSSFPSVDDYDELIYFNCSDILYEITNSRRPETRPLKFFCMEEGPTSCKPCMVDQWSRWAKVSDILRKVTKRPSVSKVEGFYCFLPELCSDDFPLTPIKIPSPVSNKEKLTDILRQVFDYKGFPYSQKYIFFASSLEVDGHSIGEVKAVSQLVDMIGVDNLLIKMHPRDGRSAYEDIGIAVMEDSHVPWEVVQLCENFSDRTFLTCISSSPIAASALMNESVRTRYLIPPNLSPEESANLDQFYRQTVVPTLNQLHHLGLCCDVREVSLDGFFQELWENPANV